MAIYKKTITTQGAWAKSSEIQNGITAKIVSETNPQPSQFLNKDGSTKNQDVAKVLFDGASESLNVSLNKTTINGLVDAFGEDSTNWKNQPLKVEVEKIRVAGKAVVALYLIPEGYEKTDDDSGYAVIVKIGSSEANKDIPITEDEAQKVVPTAEGKEIPYEDLPF